MVLMGQIQMDQEALWKEYAALSIDARRKVDQLITRLSSNRTIKRKSTPLISDPFVGMWQDRDDLIDSRGWVRSLREREWNRVSG
jgi:hypothetical protein